MLLVAHFPALVTSYMFSDFPRSPSAFATGNIFSRANSGLRVDPCLSLANKCFLRLAPRAFALSFDRLFFFLEHCNNFGFSDKIPTNSYV